MKIKELFDIEGNLKDDKIMNLIEDALKDYENGDILDAADTLSLVVRAINKFEKDY